MADLTANASLRILGELKTEKFALDSSAAQHPYKGSPMILDLSEDTLLPRAFLDATVVEEETVEASATENQFIEIAVGPTIVGFKSTVFDNADLGKTVYMSDSGTLSETAADNPQIGKLHIVRDGYAFVELTAPQICANA